LTGKKLVETILEAKKWPKSLPVITDKSVAREAASALIQASFFHRSEKVEDKKGYLMVLLRCTFLPVFVGDALCIFIRFQSVMFSKILAITPGCTLEI
jgi:hypothetical protein